MTSFRASRVGEQIKKEVSQIILEEIKDPRLGFVTITAVDVTNDLRHAKIFVSIFGDEKEVSETHEVLNNAKGFFRSEIGKRIRTRFAPELSFVLDRSLERGERISELLTKVQREED
ncbi:MAG: 30S ribosome-binding factor RbfA [Clostridia bacterium]|nr:30S ribosome-binding factor RbfA [Clostridia bacterium]